MPRAKAPNLVLINLRLRAQDVAAARRRAADLGIPYQHILRTWVAEGAQAQKTIR